MGLGKICNPHASSQNIIRPTLTAHTTLLVTRMAENTCTAEQIGVNHYPATEQQNQNVPLAVDQQGT